MKNIQTEAVKSNAMKTVPISIARTEDDEGNACYAWSFFLNGEEFGGYCQTEADALNDAEIARGVMK